MRRSARFPILVVAALSWGVPLASCRQPAQEPKPEPAPARTAREVSGPAAPAPPARVAAPTAAPGPADVSPPSAPAGLKATPTGGTIELSWAASTDDVAVTRYQVLAGSRVVAEVGGRRARITGLETSRRHCFAVRALDAAGNASPPSAAACASTPDLTPPSAPEHLVAEPRPGQVALRWAPASDDVGVAGYEVLRGEAVVATTSETAAVESGLRAAVEHCYLVRAFDAAGNRSAPSAPACAAPPDVTPPSAPGAVAASSPSETEIALRWEAATDDVGVGGYEVLKGEAVLASTRDLHASEVGLRAGTEGCYRVRAFDVAGNRGPFAPEACATTLDLTPPGRPPALTATPESDRSIRVRWEASTDNVGVAGYEVRREKDQVARTSELTALEGALLPARIYCYAVIAFDGAGNASPAAGPACATTPDLTPPSVPAGLAAAASSASQVFLAWSPSSDDVGVAGYEVLRDGAVVAKTGKTHAAEAGLAPLTEHCWSVRAFDAAGNRSEPCPPVCARTAEPATLAGPTNLQARAAGKKEVVLTWDPSPEQGVVYVVYLDGDEKGRDRVLKGASQRRIGATALTTLTVAGSIAEEQRCYRVAAQSRELRLSPATLPACARAPAPAAN